jgi:hypothetical protein
VLALIISVRSADYGMYAGACRYGFTQPRPSALRSATASFCQSADRFHVLAIAIFFVLTLACFVATISYILRRRTPPLHLPMDG